MKRDGACNSLWQDTTKKFQPGSVASPGQQFDIIIAGAGITGLTTGLALQKAGKKVLVAEAQTIGFGTTGGTTAHLNTVMDTPYNQIQKNFGNEDAKLVAEAIKSGLALIKDNINAYNIECHYKDLPAYLFSQNEKQSNELDAIYKATLESGVEVAYVDSLPVPIPFEKVLEFPGQASFHPTRYLMGLAKTFEESGGVLMENCRITKLDEGNPHEVTSSRGNFKCEHFIYATHVPPGVNLLHFRCAPYRSYAMAFQLDKEADYPDALIYDMYNPYHYYRSQEIDGEKYFIAGGEDHKTAHETNTENCFTRLESHVSKYFRVSESVNQWSSQYFEPTDGLPYIGHLPGASGNIFVATGYGGNGMTYSAVAALILKELIIAGNSKYEEVFDPNRIKLVAGFSNFMKEAADVVGKLIGKILPSEKIHELVELSPGEARVVVYEGHKLAIYKDESGKVHALSSACTHIKCDVAWNNAEKSWDCPCHGSRFSYTGEMLTAPARKDLEQIEISSLAKA